MGLRESLDLAAVSQRRVEDLRRGIPGAQHSFWLLDGSKKTSQKLTNIPMTLEWDMAMEAARTPLRHNAMIEFNPISALAGHALDVRLWPAPRALRGEVQTFVQHRASAAHARVDALGGGNSLREAA